MRSRTLGFCTALLIASLSIITTSIGVPLGANNAFQVDVSKSFKPCSCAVSASGITANLSFERRAIALNCLFLRLGIENAGDTADGLGAGVVAQENLTAGDRIVGDDALAV